MTIRVQDYRTTIADAALDEETFVRLTLKGKIDQHLPWRRVVVRPVLLKQGRHLQFSYFDEKKDITRNYRGDEARTKLTEALALPFTSIALQATGENVQVQVMKDGKAIVHRKAETGAHGRSVQPDLSHDARKALPLPADRPDPFLQTIGIMDGGGHVIPRMADKFSQTNEFLKLLEHTGALEHFGARAQPVHILDCGAGSAYLSFAAYHYLNDVRHIPAELTGVDVNTGLVAQSNQRGRDLGYEHICFATAAIADYQPEVAPDVVLALHACDTATDDALYQGIRARSHLILCAPCCHHHLHEQVQSVAPFEPILQQGILRKRMIDILTDSLRALILRCVGYKTDVIEFVSTEHTDRNLMIRAVAVAQPAHDTARYRREYEALKEFWHVTPYLETLLRAHGCWPDA